MRTPTSITGCFVLSVFASLGLLALYVIGGGAQLEGVLLGFALGGLGLGLAIWATSYMNVPEEVEERHLMGEPEPGAEDGDRGPRPGMEDLSRRKVLLRLLAGAGGTLAGALAIPAFSLGPNPGDDLFRSGWTSGDRLVNLEGKPVRPADIPVEGVETVFPEGKVGLSDAQTILIRVDPDSLALPDGREDWSPEGCLGYSKICTHVGCSVGLYRSAAQQLLCPCHQSTFDVLTGATPVFGPAARPLPQLPLAIDDEGYLIATGEYSAPVGPAFWNVDRRR